MTEVLQIRFIILAICLCISSVLFCGCSQADQETSIVLLAPIGVAKNLIDSFGEPVCFEKENGAVIRVVENNERPIRNAEIHFYDHGQKYFALTDGNGEWLLRTTGEAIDITHIARKGFQELTVSVPVTFFALPSDCRKRNIKTFLKEHRPVIYQLKKID